MSPETFYRRSLYLPYAIPFVALPFLSGRYYEGLIPALAPVALFLFVTAMMGFVPYFAVVIPLSAWMRNRSKPKIRRALLIWPLLVLGASVVFVLVINGLDRPGSLTSQATWNVLVAATFTVLGLGYFWVSCVLLIGQWLEKRETQGANPNN